MSLSSSNDESPNQSSSNEPAKVTLVIDNFNSATDYQFREFTLPSNDQIKFRLFCYSQDQKNMLKKTYTTMYLYLRSCDRDRIVVRHKMSILNASGDKCETQERVETFYKTSPGALFHILQDHIKTPENKLLVNGKLSIYCEVEEIDANMANLQIKSKLPENPVLNNYESLLESGKFSDFTLIIGEKKLMAHKNILSAQSKVFAAMFENDCEEKRQNQVTITDLSVEVCEQMLRYIYTGKIPLDLNEYAADLFVVADKYQLDHLKSVCEQHLCSTLSVESVATTLLLADMHHATVLKSKCIDYITDNMTKVMATDGWTALTAARIELSLELLKQIAIKTNR